MLIVLWSAVIMHMCPGARMNLPDTLKQNGIYYSARDYIENRLSLSFDRKDAMHFREPIFSHSLLLKATDTTYHFYYDDLWGYRRAGKDLRVWNDKAYHLFYSGKIYLYDEDILTDKVNLHAMYFSTGADAPVKELNKKNLEEAYHANTKFIQKLSKLKWYQSLYRKNKQTGTYQFIDWL